MKLKKTVLIACCVIVAVGAMKLFSTQMKALFIPEPISCSQGAEYHRVVLQKGQFVRFARYRGEPIVWRVLDVKENTVLLLSEKVLCFKAMNVPDAHHPLGSNDFAHCSLKQWLNDTAAENDTKSLYEGEAGFLNEANFTERERSCLSRKGVFLLSEKALGAYLDSAQRVKYPSVQAVRADTSPFVRLPGMAVWYYTASKNDTSSMSVVAVTGNGGFYKTPANDSACGIAPAVELTNRTFYCTGGEGSLDAPYEITMDENEI